MLDTMQAKVDEVAERFCIDGYTVELRDNYRNSRGRCNYRRKLITIARGLTVVDANETWETLIHEIAHMVAFEVYRHSAHGPAWRKVYEGLGGRGGSHYAGTRPDDHERIAARRGY